MYANESVKLLKRLPNKLHKELKKSERNKLTTVLTITHTYSLQTEIVTLLLGRNYIKRLVPSSKQDE